MGAQRFHKFFKKRWPRFATNPLKSPKIASLRLRKAFLQAEKFNKNDNTSPLRVELKEGRISLLDDAPRPTRSDIIFSERKITITTTSFVYEDETYPLSDLVDGAVHRFFPEKWPIVAGALYMLLGVFAALSPSAGIGEWSLAFVAAALGAAMIYRDLTPAYALILEFQSIVARDSTNPNTLYFESYDSAYIHRAFEALEKAIFGE